MYPLSNTKTDLEIDPGQTIWHLQIQEKMILRISGLL